MAMSAEHRSRFAAHISEKKFRVGRKTIHKQTENSKLHVGDNYDNYMYVCLKNLQHIHKVTV